MKKIFSVLLCSLLFFSIFFSLNGTVSAADNSFLKGIWYFTDSPILPDTTITFSGDFTLPDFNKTITFNGLTITSTRIYATMASNASMTFDIYNNGAYNMSSVRKILFSNNTANSTFFSWLRTSANKISDTAEMPTHCNGSMCETTPDVNGDNICDTCNLPFVFSLRNDVYDFNGYSFALNLESGTNDTPTIFDLWETVRVSNGDMILLADNDNFDSALLYTFSNKTIVENGQVITQGSTLVSLYKASYDSNNNPYWKLSARDTWNTVGALVAPVDQVHWSAEDISNNNGTVIINGDENFRVPLWEKVEAVTQGTIPSFLIQGGQTMAILTITGLGCLALLISLPLLSKIFRPYRH